MARAVLTFSVVVLVAAVFAGCGDENIQGDDVVGQDAIEDAAVDADVGPGQPDIAYWEAPAAYEYTGGIYDEVPAVFSRLSGYRTSIDGTNPPDPSFMGASGVGNGLVFALFGYGNPTNSMHSFAGPGYTNEGGFFSDYSLHLAAAGDSTLPAFDEEMVDRSLDAPVVITYAAAGSLELHSVAFAPWFDGEVQDGSDQDSLRHCVIRYVMVRNSGDTQSADTDFVVKAWGDFASPSDGVMVEERGSRMLVTRIASGGGAVDTVTGTMTLNAGVIEPGAEKTFVLTHCAYASGEIPGLPEIDVPALLSETAQAYGTWESGLVDVVTPDQMVNDFIDGMKLSLKLQTSEQGATCPMSEYTRTWARDNMGPVLGMLSLGGFEDVEGYLDYVYYAILTEGDLKNSYPAMLDLDWDAVTVPDWASMAPLGDGSAGKKRVSAETPSYMVLMYGLHNRFTGKLDRIIEREALLHRCLFAQGFSENDLLPFTGDETYRAGMNAAMGLQLEEPHEDENWSGNSSALWLGAAREYQRFMSAADIGAEAAEAAARFDEVEPVTINTYTLDDDCFAAFVSMDDLTPSAPFEDVSLQVTWSGWKDGDDEYAQKAFKCLYDTLKTVDGEICSELDRYYGGIPIFRNAWKGVYTGMLPGYTLHSMTVLGHPDAQAAFNMVRQSLSTSGNLQEYLILDDHTGMTIMYNADGLEPSDYTAKYRPWEGGIVLDAVMQYLFGFEPDANIGTMVLRPHLPNNWPTMSATGLRGADDRFDVTVTATKTGHQVRVAASAGNNGTWAVKLRWDLVGGVTFARALVDGVEVEAGSVTTIENVMFGQPSIVFPDFDVAPGSEVFVVIEESQVAQ